MNHGLLILNLREMSENEMAGWHHRCNGHDLGQTSGDGEGQRDWCAAVHGVAKSRTQLGENKCIC